GAAFMTGPEPPSSEGAASAPEPVTTHRERKTMSAITIDRTGTRDGLLRLAMRADAVLTGLAGVAGIPLAGWLADTSGTTRAFEYGMAAFFIAYGVVVFGLAALPSVRSAGMA